MADGKRAAKRKLEKMLMVVSGHQDDLAAYLIIGDASGVTRCERALRIDYSLIREHCTEHDLERPRDVPAEAAQQPEKIRHSYAFHSNSLGSGGVGFLAESARRDDSPVLQ